MEKGAYRELLDYQWLHGAVPTDIGSLAGILGVSTGQAKKLWARISGRFPGGCNRRLEREREKALARMERAVLNGRKGAEAKQQHKGSSSYPSANQHKGSSSHPQASLKGGSTDPHASVSVSVSHTNDVCLDGDEKAGDPEHIGAIIGRITGGPS